MALLRTIIAVLFLTVPTAAQQQVDSQRVLVALQQQRNEALDRAALAEARLAQANDDVQKLKAEIEKMKQKDGNP